MTYRTSSNRSTEMLVTDPVFQRIEEIIKLQNSARQLYTNIHDQVIRATKQYVSKETAELFQDYLRIAFAYLAHLRDIRLAFSDLTAQYPNVGTRMTSAEHEYGRVIRDLSELL